MLVRHSSQTRGMQSLQRRLAFAGRTVGNIDAPHMIVVAGLHAPQQVRIDLMLKIPFAQVGPRTDAGYPHLTHAALDTFPIDIPPFTAQHGGDTSSAVRRVICVYPVNVVLQSHLLVRLVHSLIVQGGAVDAQQFGLLTHRNLGMLRLHHCPPFVRSPSQCQLFF